MLSVPDYKGFRYKPRSISAGLYCSYILMDDRRLFRTGKVGTDTLKTPSKFKFVKKFFNGRMADDFTPLKVICKWSKLITVTYVLFADFRKCQISKTVREKFVNKINNTWGTNNSQLLPTHDDLLAKHIWYKYLQKPGKHFPPNLSFSGKSRLKKNSNNRWPNQDYDSGEGDPTRRSFDPKKSNRFIKTGIDWKNKKIISQETGLGEEINRNINYVEDAERLNHLARNQEQAEQVATDQKFKKKHDDSEFRDMILVGDDELRMASPSKSPGKTGRSRKTFSGRKAKGGLGANARSPQRFKKMSRNGSPSLSNRMSKAKVGNRFTSPSLPGTELLRNQEEMFSRNNQAKLVNFEQERLSQQVTFSENPVTNVLTSKELLKDIQRLKKKKHLTSDQKKLLAIYEKMS